ncbi:MAG TPA: translation elongation factor 4 [Clostridiales bacterium]|nr:translation elongation factor 4 [Clostridiales bacterium]
MTEKMENIRNFCIIAHIDHGKSTLADRILERTGAVAQRDMEQQLLDNMELERERGITIKLQAVHMTYEAQNGKAYTLNLIDTPGHVDFNYEVSRSLAACEGALLVVDAVQGIEAQTLANAYLAVENDLELIPVINKIDLPNADPEHVKEQIEEVLGIDASEALLVSAKTGEGVEAVLEAVVKQIPPPTGDRNGRLQALIFDSHFDSYKGAIPYLRVINGEVRKGSRVTFMGTKKTFDVTEVGIFTPPMKLVDCLTAGDVGYIAASIKNVKDTQVGDTVTDADRPAVLPLPGYRRAMPMVYCGIYPMENSDYDNLKDALEKLALNDSALIYEPETSAALGFGFRCGFLGLLHMEIFEERLEREYRLELITTAPSVDYMVYQTNGEILHISNPSDMPEIQKIESLEEPFVKATIMSPKDYIGSIMELVQERRGIFKNMEYISVTRVMLTYDLPLSEVIFDFFDQLKSRTRGYASLDYEFSGYRDSDLVKLDILVNGDIVDALSIIVHKENAYRRGRQLTEKLRKLIPRQLFEVTIQAAIGNKVIARESVKALRKNVIEKCYGGDISRKRKLLEKQKEGKKRMKQMGNVEIPQEAFMAVLKLDES